MKFENVVIKPGFPRSRPIYIYKGYNGEILLYVVMQLPFIVLLLLYCNIVHWKSNIVHSTRTQKQGSFRNSIFSKLTENNIIIKTRQLITFGILSFDKRSYMQLDWNMVIQVLKHFIIATLQSRPMEIQLSSLFQPHREHKQKCPLFSSISG